MKKALRKGIIAILLISLTVAIFSHVQSVLSRKVSINRYGDLIYNNPQPDILFVGTSHVMDAIIPVKLWEETGLRSYVLCAEYNDMKRNIAMCQLALQYCHPRVIVLDIDKYWEKSNFDDTFIGFHEFADGFPLNLQKIESTVSLYGKTASSLEILFPIIRYHDRWKDLSRSDYRNTHGESEGMLGYEFSLKSEAVERSEYIDESQAVLYEGTDNIEIEKFIIWCQEQGIQVVLTTIPYNATEDEQAALWGVNSIADRYQVPYINMVSMYDMVDSSTDFKDEGHMNYSGACKVTAFMGNYFVNKGVSVSSLTEDGRLFWERQVEFFNSFVDSARQEED